MAKRNRTYTKGTKEYERRREKVGKVLVGVKGDYKLDNIKQYLNRKFEGENAGDLVEINDLGNLVVSRTRGNRLTRDVDEIVSEINSWKKDQQTGKAQLRERSLESHLIELEDEQANKRLKMFYNAGYQNMKEVADALGVSELDAADNSRWESTSAGTRFLMKNANGEVVGAKEFVFGYGGQAWFQENVVGRDESGVYLLQVDKNDVEEYDTATNLFKQKDPKRHRVWFKSKDR